MHINLRIDGNVTEASRVYTEQYSKQFFDETVNHQTLQPTPSIPLVTKQTFVWRVPTPKRSNSVGFIPKKEIWPPYATEAPVPTKTNPLYNGILGGVLVVVIVWVAVMVIFLRNKLLARKQRRERLSPPHSSTQSNFDSSTLRTETNSQFGLHTQSELSIIDIGTNIESSPLFAMHQPTAPNAAVSSQSQIDGQPPSYEEIYPYTKGIKPSFEEQPPTYVQAQQQRIQVER